MIQTRGGTNQDLDEEIQQRDKKIKFLGYKIGISKEEIKNKWKNKLNCKF